MHIFNSKCCAFLFLFKNSNYKLFVTKYKLEINPIFLIYINFMFVKQKEKTLCKSAKKKKRKEMKVH